MTSPVIRVLLADDQALVRGAIAALLDLEHDLEVVAEVGRGDEVVEAARTSQADVCLIDIEMPGTTGIEAARRLRDELPDVRSLIVTTFGRPGYLRQALEAGVSGFLVKDTPVDRLVDGIRRAAGGLRVVDPDLAAASLSIGASPLTEREALVLAASAGGVPWSRIAPMISFSITSENSRFCKNLPVFGHSAT